MFRQISSTLQRASARRLGTASLPAGASPPPPQNATSSSLPPVPKSVRATLAENKDVIQVVSLIATGCAALLAAGNYAVGKITKLETDLQNLKENIAANKEHIPTKAELVRVETKVDAVAKQASLKAQVKAYEINEGKKPKAVAQDKAVPPSPSEPEPSQPEPTPSPPSSPPPSSPPAPPRSSSGWSIFGGSDKLE
jgi:hypothetical protein